jgi:hypothetical protein
MHQHQPHNTSYPSQIFHSSIHDQHHPSTIQNTPTLLFLKAIHHRLISDQNPGPSDELPNRHLPRRRYLHHNLRLPIHPLYPHALSTTIPPQPTIPSQPTMPLTYIRPPCPPSQIRPNPHANLHPSPLTPHPSNTEPYSSKRPSPTPANPVHRVRV